MSVEVDIKKMKRKISAIFDVFLIRNMLDNSIVPKSTKAVDITGFT